MAKLPPNKSGTTEQGCDREGDNAAILKPGVLLTLFQHNLQRTQPQYQQKNALPVDRGQGGKGLLLIRRQGP